MYDDPLMNYLYRSRSVLSSGRTGMMNGMPVDAVATARLAVLRMEHRDLDDAIEALRASARPDQLQLARLKKRKLRLRDEIQQIADALVPDIIA